MNTKVQTKGKSKGLQKASGITLSVSSMAWHLLRLNLLFLVFSIPILTAPAAAAAMTKVLMKLTRGDDADVWRVFWAEFKTGFFKAFMAGLIIIVLAAVVGLIGYMVMQLGGLIGALGVAFIIVFGLWLYVSSCYLFVLISTVDLSLLNCVRNAVLLALLETKQNLLLLIPLVLMAACAALFPVSLPLLLFVMFSLCQLMVCTVTGKVIQKRIIEPHEKQSNHTSHTIQIQS
jgi:uncharacterized membrane protein YesL